MQCADLLDKHVGSIAELPKQSIVSVVPPGLRQVALAARSQRSTLLRPTLFAFLCICLSLDPFHVLKRV